MPLSKDATMTQGINKDVGDKSQKRISSPPFSAQHRRVVQQVQPSAVGGALSALPQLATDDHVYLIGRPPMAEFMGFVQAQTINGSRTDLRALADEWRKANDHICSLERTEAGWADNPTIGDIKRDLLPLRQAILNDPLFRRAYAILPAEIGVVELDRLVVFQKQINLGFVRSLQSLLGLPPSDETIFNVFLPFKQPTPPFQVRRVAPG